MSLTSDDLQNIHACIGFASATVDADALPALSELVLRVAALSKSEEQPTPDDCLNSKKVITLALQSQKIVPNRQFDASVVATLGKLVSKLNTIIGSSPSESRDASASS